MRARPSLLLCALLLAVPACGDDPPAPTAFKKCTPKGFTSVGEMLPDCTFEGFPGTPPLRLWDLKGKPVVLNFWASWCIDCVRELPAFQRVFSAMGGKVTFVGMNTVGVQGETRAAGESFAKRTGVKYLLAFDEGGLLYQHFSQRTLLPVTIYVGSDLRVKEIHFGGPIPDAELKAAISKHLGVE